MLRVETVGDVALGSHTEFADSARRGQLNQFLEDKAAAEDDQREMERAG